MQRFCVGWSSVSGIRITRTSPASVANATRDTVSHATRRKRRENLFIQCESPYVSISSSRRQHNMENPREKNRVEESHAYPAGKRRILTELIKEVHIASAKERQSDPAENIRIADPVLQ